MEYTIQEMECLMNYIAGLYHKDVFQNYDTYEIQEEESGYCQLEFHLMIQKILLNLSEEERIMILREFLSSKNPRNAKIDVDETVYKEQKNKALRAFFRCLYKQKML